MRLAKKPKFTDAHEAFGKQVQQEPAQELVERQGQQLLLVVVGGVAPAKNDLAIGEGDHAMVGDGDAMSVATQILKHELGATKGALQVDHPVLSVAWLEPEPDSEDLGLSQKLQVSMEVELAMVKGLLESLDEL